MVKDYPLILFIILVVTIPFLYRLVHIGNLGWFVRNNHLNDDRNYKKAEILRVYQVLLGFSFFLYHGFLFMGFQNIIQLVFLASFISMVAEIIGSRTGIIFGGVYKYNSNKTPGYIFMGIPLLIPIAWFGLIYMALNFCHYLYGSSGLIKLESLTFTFIFLPSIMLALIDVVLDPIAVNEKRWEWKAAGKYYGVPFLNFVGWFILSILILMIFSILYVPVNKGVHHYSFFMEFSPGLLFVFLHLVAARPCFERKLIIPGIIGILLFLTYSICVLII